MNLNFTAQFLLFAIEGCMWLERPELTLIYNGLFRPMKTTNKNDWLSYNTTLNYCKAELAMLEFC